MSWSVTAFLSQHCLFSLHVPGCPVHGGDSSTLCHKHNNDISVRSKKHSMNKPRLLHSLAHTRKKLQGTKLDFLWIADMQLLEKGDQSLMSLIPANVTLPSSKGSSQQKCERIRPRDDIKQTFFFLPFSKNCIARTVKHEDMPLNISFKNLHDLGPI